MAANINWLIQLPCLTMYSQRFHPLRGCSVAVELNHVQTQRLVLAEVKDQARVKNHPAMTGKA